MANQDVFSRYHSFILYPGIKKRQELAESGFYYEGVGDNVKCFSCKIEMQAWKEMDIVDLEHLKRSPNCMFIQKKLSEDTKSVFISHLAILQMLNELKKDVCALKEVVNDLEIEI